MPIDLFKAWQVYLAKRKLEHSKSDYALARLCQTVHNALSAGGEPAQLEDFLIVFKSKEEIEKEEIEIFRLRNERTMKALAQVKLNQEASAKKALEANKNVKFSELSKSDIKKNIRNRSKTKTKR